MLNLGRKGRGDPPPPEPRPEGPSDAEVIARACWVIKASMDDEAQTKFRGAANVPLVDLCLDLRAVLVKSPAGRAVLRGLIPGQDGDPIDRRLKAADQDVAELTAELGKANAALAQERADHAEARREMVTQLETEQDVVDRILQSMPESWDGEEAGSSIALAYVGALQARLRALGVPDEKTPERPDGTEWPDPTTDPNGFRDAADAYRALHAGCRCKAFGDGTPEHAPSFLCKPETRP